MTKKPFGEQPNAVWRQHVMSFLGNLGIMSIGLALGLPTVTLDQLTDPTEAVHLNQSQASWYASLHLLVAPFGGLICSLILDKIGRKKCLVFMNLLSILSWTCLAFVSEKNTSNAFYQLLASRFFIGIVTGIGGAPAGLYSAEISIPKTRALLILFTSIAISGGITVIYLLGYLIPNNFRQIAIVMLCYQIIALLCVLPMPETSSWLISKGRLNEAKKSLNYFRGLNRKTDEIYDEIEAEFSLLQKSIQKKIGEEEPSILELIRLPEVYKPLLIMIGLFVCQQFSGIFIVIVYAVQITNEAGVEIDPFKCAVFIGVARLVTTCPLGWVYDKWGRRQAGIISAFGMTICMWILAGRRFVSFVEIPHLPIAAIVAYIFFSTIGLYTLPFFLNSELFPQKARGACSGTSLACGMLLSFIAVKTYPSIRNSIGTENYFALLGLNSFLSILFVYFFLPETKGRTLLEIEEGFRGRNNDPEKGESCKSLQD